MDESVMKIAAMLLLCVLPVIAAAQASAPMKGGAKQDSGNPVWKEESPPEGKSKSTTDRADVKQQRASGKSDATTDESYGSAPPAKGKASAPTQTRKEAKDQLAQDRKSGKAQPQNDETYGAPDINPPPKSKKMKTPPPAASAP
jgi:hypothetical protein